MTSDETEVLSIGAVFGGVSASTRPWREAIRKLTLQVIALREGLKSVLNLNVVYQVPGEVVTVDFEGVRTGRYNKARRLLLVQVAVPKDAPADVDEHLKRGLVSAIKEAENWARKRRIAETLTDLHEFADSL